jgi:hypothetical protein
VSPWHHDSQFKPDAPNQLIPKISIFFVPFCCKKNEKNNSRRISFPAAVSKNHQWL